MLSLRRSIKYTLQSYIKYNVHFCSRNLFQKPANEAENEHKFSVRQSEWKLAQERYAKHPLILYSNKLEEQVEFMSPQQLRTYKHKEVLKEKLKLRYLRKQPLIPEPERSVNVDDDGDNNFPSNWMDDYEFYKGNDDGKHAPYGTADNSIPPSSVPCSGCGAHLHCTRANLPG